MRSLRSDMYRPDEVATVHVMAKTVRHFYYFGYDRFSEMCFEHRRGWINQLLHYHAKHFGIDLVAYAIMANHFHLILRSRPDVVATWSDTEVAERWLCICPKRKDPSGQPLPPTDKELDAIRTKPKEVIKIRSRLSDISWWMRLVCQRIAQKANCETKETGRFFNGRFKSTRLFDDQAVLACMAYIDLNPIRAGVAKTLEESQYTSICERIKAIQQRVQGAPEESDSHLSPVELVGSCESAKVLQIELDADAIPIAELAESKEAVDKKPTEVKKRRTRCSDKGVLSMTMLSYLELLDLTARLPRADKPCNMTEGVPPILKRLGIDIDHWRLLTQKFSSLFSLAAGSAQTMDAARTLVTDRKYYCRAYLGKRQG